MVIPKVKRGAKRFYWDLVLNNYTSEDCEVVKQVFQENCQAYIVAKEIGSVKNTPHLQMCVKLKKGNYKSYILNLFKYTCVGKRISIREIRNIEACKNYCLKDNNILFMKEKDKFLNTVKGKSFDEIRKAFQDEAKSKMLVGEDISFWTNLI